jgi:hypothetical protein
VYVVSVDPASSKDGDFLALVVVEARLQDSGGLIRRALDGRLIHRLVFAERHRGMSFLDVPALVAKRIRLIAAHDVEHGRRSQTVILTLDATGLGRALVDLIVESGGCGEDRFVPVVVTSGLREGLSDAGLTIPKRDVVLRAMRVAGEGRFIVSRGLKLAGEIEREFASLEAKVRSGGHETFEAAGSKKDDLAFASSLAVYIGERFGTAAPAGSVRVAYA